MRTLALWCALLAGSAASLAWTSTAAADVTDAERAAARDLFKQGDELQRAGKFADALDKFQRAEQVIQAPTNVLRIAECQAALNKLVEAAESYRTVIRWTLPPGSPPAFQSAVDQAKGELAQVEPRIPKVLVQATPASAKDAQLVVDGTTMPGALIGVPVPIDPGDHKILVSAPGYSSSEQTVTLHERETKNVQVDLKPIPGLAAPPPVAPVGSGTENPPPPPAPYASAEPAPAEPPPEDKKKNRPSLLIGGHLGLDIPTGKVPLPQSASGPNNNPPVDMGNFSGPGLAVGLDAGVRFARMFYLGLNLNHGVLGGGKDASSLGSGTSVSSQTTEFGVTAGFILNPDRVSLYMEIGVQERWYSLSLSQQPNGVPQTLNYQSSELFGGIGAWIPIGRLFRMIPLASIAAGSFNEPKPDGSVDTATSNGNGSHVFFMLGAKGFFNIDL